MALYRITVTLKNKVVKGIRELEQEDIDIAWQVFQQAAVQVYSADKILDFEVVKVSRFSDEYREWKLKNKKTVNDKTGIKNKRSRG